MPDTTVASLFLAFSRAKLLDQFWPRLRTCVESLSDEQIWWRPNEASNSIGNLMLHLNGNVTQWLIASFGRGDDRRDRPTEFAAKDGISRNELVEKLGHTVSLAGQVLERLSEPDLLAEYDIQGYRVTGLDAVYQVVEHFGLHYGQIAYITKMLRDKDLGFYRDLNATGRATQAGRP